jgi:hypothetical protein
MLIEVDAQQVVLGRQIDAAADFAVDRQIGKGDRL